MTYALVLSLILHGLLVVLVGLQPKGKGDGKNSKTGTEQGMHVEGHNKTIIPKQIEIELVEPIPSVGSELPTPIPPKQEQVTNEGIKECFGNNWYGGVGITIGSDRIIAVVAPGYPAAQAGLKAGDQIVSSENSLGFSVDLRGDPGSEVFIEVFRPITRETLTLTLVRAKICTEE